MYTRINKKPTTVSPICIGRYTIGIQTWLGARRWTRNQRNSIKQQKQKQNPAKYYYTIKYWIRRVDPYQPRGVDAIVNIDLCGFYLLFFVRYLLAWPVFSCSLNCIVVVLVFYNSLQYYFAVYAMYSYCGCCRLQATGEIQLPKHIFYKLTVFISLSLCRWFAEVVWLCSQCVWIFVSKRRFELNIGSFSTVHTSKDEYL